MTARYRLVHYIPDPFTGARMPLGAVVQGVDGAVRVVRVEHLPLGCIPDRTEQLALLQISAMLDSIDQPDRLPRSFGPDTTLSAAQAVPAGVADPLSWVSNLLNPPRKSADKPAAVRGPTRASYGYGFFRTWAVAHLVRKGFNPVTDAGGWLRNHTTLQEMSHWVDGTNRVLLMEPVVPTRPHFAEELRDVVKRLAVYKPVLGRTSAGRQGELIAYVTAGGPEARRAEAMEQLATYADQVVDVDDDTARAAFLHRIREVGEDSGGQGNLSFPDN